MIEKKTTHVDITPDKSIFHKIGEANYSTSDAIAELVDNSIDAMEEDGVEIHVLLDYDAGKITVSDNGKGMTKEAAAKALVLAHSNKKEALGEFGLGLKSACMSLGKHFTLTTTSHGQASEYILTYDKEEFMSKGDWTKFPITESPTTKAEHGTTIEITDLRVKLYAPLVKRIRDDLAQRYGPFILHNNVVIKVGKKRATAEGCEPSEPKLDAKGKTEVKYVLPSGQKIFGWWALLETASGAYSGFNMFRRNRLIRANERLGYNPHPMTNHIVGELYLDPVPVTHNKREFITQSGEFRDFIENYWGDRTGNLMGEKKKGVIDDIFKIATERWNKEKADKQLPENIKDKVKEDVLRALNRVDEFKELAFPGTDGKKKRSSDGEESEIETRNTRSRIATEEPIEDKSRENDGRTPSKLKRQTAKYIVINGKKLRFDFEFRDLGDETKDKEVALSEGMIEVYINTGFKGFSLSQDSTFYSVFHVSEAIADIYLREAGQSSERIFELRNRLLSEVATVMLEEEELKQLVKHEEELERVRQEKTKLMKKAELSRL